MEQKILDKGIYIFEITSVDPMHDAIDDDNVWAIGLKDVATGEETVAYAANNLKNKEVFWSGFECEFNDIPSIVGRVYMFPVRVVKIGDLSLNAVQAPVHLVSAA